VMVLAAASQALRCISARPNQYLTAAKATHQTQPLRRQIAHHVFSRPTSLGPSLLTTIYLPMRLLTIDTAIRDIQVMTREILQLQ